MFQWYFTVNLFFEPMIVQDFFKDVNVACVTSDNRFVSRVVNEIKVLKIVAK